MRQVQKKANGSISSDLMEFSSVLGYCAFSSKINIAETSKKKKKYENVFIQCAILIMEQTAYVFSGKYIFISPLYLLFI